MKLKRASDRFRMAGGLLLVFAAGTAFGLGAGKWLDRSRSEPMSEWRQAGGYRFINPLLECEGAAEQLGLPELVNLRQVVDSYLAGIRQQGVVTVASVYFRRLNDGPWMSLNGNEPFRGASLFKVPLAMACLRKAESDPGLLGRELVYRETVDLNLDQTYRPREPLVKGNAYAVGELVRRLLQDSDNNAGILLKEVVSDEDYRRMIAAIFPSRPGVPRDSISVRDYSAAFRVLYNASFLGRDASEMLLSIMSRSSFDQGIVAGVPPEVAVANKFGESSVDTPEGTMAEFHEFGIIYHPRQPYLLGVMLMGPDQKPMPGVLRELSAMVYREFDSRQ